MRVSRKQAGRNRVAVVNAASWLFRARSFDGVGVVEISREPGLSPGGFYGQFQDGKEGLEVEALSQAFSSKRDNWGKISEGKTPREALSTIIDSYLSEALRVDLGVGCPIPALGAEAARRTPKVRTAFTEGLRTLLEAVTLQAPDKTAFGTQLVPPGNYCFWYSFFCS